MPLLSLEFKLRSKGYRAPDTRDWGEKPWTDLRHCCLMGSAPGTWREGRATCGKTAFIFGSPGTATYPPMLLAKSQRNAGLLEDWELVSW